MYDPSMRVLTVLELLQAHEEMSGPELARRLEVSLRTVQRYIQRLQDLGIPVEGKRGVGGAYRLKSGFHVPPMMFTGPEALALALGLQALRLMGLDALTPAAQAANSKLLRSLPEGIRENVRALEAGIELDASPFVVTTDASLLSVLIEAVHVAQVVEFTYSHPQKVSTRRRVEVYRVVHFTGRWYIVGRCQLRKAMRCFRLDRISQYQVIDEYFTPLPHFDAIAFLNQAMPNASTRYKVSVWISVPPEDLSRFVSAWYTNIHAENGGTRLTCERDHLEGFAATLLAIGGEIQIDEPPELIETFTNLARRCQAILATQNHQSVQ